MRGGSEGNCANREGKATIKAHKDGEYCINEPYLTNSDTRCRNKESYFTIESVERILRWNSETRFAISESNVTNQPRSDFPIPYSLPRLTRQS
jgi:hypothetical protein